MDQLSSTPLSNNQLLSALAPEDFDRLRPRLEPVDLPLRLTLEEPNMPIEHVYFMEQGVTSVVAIGGGDRKIEVGIIGWEGMTGLSVVMGNDRSPNHTFVQVAGHGLRIAADDLRETMRESPAARVQFLHYALAFMTQTAHTALANGRAKLDERLARWLLMAQDRLRGDDIPIVHEYLALMLGVRRAGVTEALHMLEGQGLIRSERGLITLLDRAGLEAAADGCYGVPEAEYRRLIG